MDGLFCFSSLILQRSENFFRMATSFSLDEWTWVRGGSSWSMGVLPVPCVVDFAKRSRWRTMGPLEFLIYFEVRRYFFIYCVLLCFIDPRVRKIRNEDSSCPGIFSRTLRSYYGASSPSSPLPHLLDGHRKLVGRSAIPARSCPGPVRYH